MAPHEEHLFEEIKRYVGFDEGDEARLRAVGPRVVPHALAITDDFYRHILEHHDARRAITGGDAQVGSLKRTLVVWLRELFEGPWDLAYYERRARIGRRHVAIDLPQQYMFTAVSVIRDHLCRIVLDTAASPDTGRAELFSVNRLLDLELAIMLHTYRENSLARLQRTERLATFGQFAASIAHELRNPLGVIESSTFLLRKRVGDSSEPITRHIDKISAQVQLSNRIISSLLDLVRERPPTPRDVPVRELLTAAMEPLPATTTTIELDVPDEPLVLHVDLDQARQIVANLLSNGLEAAGPTGTVAVRVRPEGAAVLITVNDTGPGIDPTIRSRLFEPLVSTKVRGIGLGLALCRRLAERNGGTITVASGRLPGASFELRLPRAELAGGIS